MLRRKARLRAQNDYPSKLLTVFSRTMNTIRPLVVKYIKLLLVVMPHLLGSESMVDENEMYNVIHKVFYPKKFGRAIA